MTAVMRAVELHGFADVVRCMSELRRPATQQEVEGNLAFVHDLAKPTLVARMLAEIVESPSLTRLIASRSYRHVNHFDKIVLVDPGDEGSYRLTIHLWVPPYADWEVNEELIHDHRFSFWSAVLAGDLRSENFGVDGNGEQFKQYQYVPEKSGTATLGNLYRYIGEARLDRINPSHKRAGEAYYMPFARIHRVQLPRETTTCTLVLRGPRERQFANVFSSTYPDQNSQLRNTMFTIDQLRDRLELLADAMGRQNRSLSRNS